MAGKSSSGEKSAGSAAAAGSASHFRPRWTSLWGVLTIQTQNAFNDKFAQFVLLGLAVVLLDAETAEKYPHLLGLMLSLPFVIFAPVAGWMSDRFSKKSVLLGCLYAQISILVLICGALKAELFAAATFGFFLLAVQSAFFSPAKLGILKELVGASKLGVASGWGQMLTIIAIIAGSWLGGQAFEEFASPEGETPWSAAFIPILIICAASAGAIIVGHRLHRTPAATTESLRAEIFYDHFRQLGELFRSRALRLTALGIAYFWFAGAFAQLLIVEVGIDLAGPEDKKAAAAISGLMQAKVGVGIAIGSLLVAFLSWQRIELGIVPLGGAGLAAASLAAWLVPPDGAAFGWSLFGIGIASSFFLVPLNAFLQDLADPARRGRVLAASGLLDSLAVLAGIGVQAVLVEIDVPPPIQFLILALLTLLATVYVVRLLPRNLIRFLALSALRIIYRIRPIGEERVPESGGALMMANHLSYIDAFVISAACRRDIRFVIFDHYYSVRWMRPLLRLFGVIPISPKRAKDAVRVVSDALKAGDLVCIFPEGQLSRTGCLNEVKKGFELMLRASKVPVVPVWLECLWGSIFTFERGRFIKKRPYRFPYHVLVTFGDPIPPTEATAPSVRRALTRLSAEALASRKEIDSTLPAAMHRALLRRPGARCFVEFARRRRPLSRAVTLATAKALGRVWRESIPGQRVGVALPPSSAAVLIWLGLLFARKTPIAIPITDLESLGRTMDALARFEIETVISAASLIDGLPDAGFPDDTRDMATELKSAAEAGILRGVAAAWLRPRWTVRRETGAPALREAAGFLRAGADGNPALTVLTHQQILASFCQIDNTNLYRAGDVIAPAVPLASAAGLMFWTVYPILKGIPAACIPVTADAATLGDALRREAVTWIVSDGAASLEMLAHPSAGSVESLRMISVFGPDPLPAGLQEEIESRHGADVCPCHSDDTAGIIVSISMSHPHADTITAQSQDGIRPGALGRILPGFDTALQESNTPSITLEGPSLGAAGNFGAFARLDADGFLSLPGRPDTE